jgi:flagellar hook-associated protein 1
MMNLFSALELGKNSILTHQQVFHVIGHNIANVNTEGYSRQIFDLESVPPSVIGLKDGGRGVNLFGLRSVRDRFIDNQIIERKGYEGKYSTLTTSMSAIETLFDESTGLGISDSLTNFFNAWQDVANQPTDIPTRNSLVSKSTSFATQLNNTYQRLIDQQEIFDGNIAVLAEEVNTIIDEVAELNAKIAYAEGSNVPANDLLDQRERVIRELSEKIDINFYFEQSNHSVTIETSGRPLVSFNNVNHLSVVRNQYNSNYYDVFIDQYGQPAYNITNEITGGKMGAYIEARDGVVVSGPGQVSDGGTDAGLRVLNFTQSHGLSVGDLVTINGQTRSVAEVVSPTAVRVADFTAPPLDPAINYNWEQRDGYIPEYKNQLNKLATGLILNVNSLHQAGYGLNDATAPNRNFFDMSTGTGNANITNGSAAVTILNDVRNSLSVGDVFSVNGESRLITGLTYNTGTNTTNITVDSAFNSPTAAYSWEYANVETAATLLRVESAIEADPSLIAASSQPTAGAGNAIGNNEVALQIAQLLDTGNVVDTDNDGTADYGTFHEYLHGLFTEIGNAGNSASYELDANEGMLNYLENRRDSISAVSLDEEASDLMRFEKSYQALTKFMGTISQMTELLMQIV